MEKRDREGVKKGEEKRERECMKRKSKKRKNIE